MARSGFWFQWARGRALVRTRAMKEARYWWNLAVNGAADDIRSALRRDGAGDVWALSDATVRTFAEQKVRRAVARAREANRDWRKYRACHLEFERDPV